jgi:hypothetical protein
VERGPRSPEHFVDGYDERVDRKASDRLMAVHINVGFGAEEGDKQWKHLDARCPVLLARGAQGFTARTIRNPDEGKPPAEHQLRRCPVCFEDGGPLRSQPDPVWLGEARGLEQAHPDARAWVYDLMFPSERRSQVGMASDLCARLRRRWKATCRSRFGKDCIPWYYDLLTRDPTTELVLAAVPYCSREEALAAERALRQQKLANGWDVTSSV